MKTTLKTLFFSLVLMVIGITLSCTSGNTPEAVAEKFAESIYTADFEKARECATPDASDAIGFIEGMTAKHVEDMKASNPDVKVLSCEVNKEEKTAKVELEIKNYFDLNKKQVNTEPETEKYNLKEVDGKWLVAFNGN